MENQGKKSGFKWWLPLTIIGALTVGYFASTFFSSSTKEQTKEKETKEKNMEDTASSENTQHAPIVSPFIPEKMTFANTEIPLGITDVKEKLDRELVINCYWHSNTIFYLKRAARWFPLIEPILKEQNIPDDFKYLAVIESGLDNVVSPSGAAGYWQFMRGTALDYGLEVTGLVDERYHPEKATYAACKYLHHAHLKYDDWMLAAASYNMGKAALSRRLEEQKVDSYFKLLLNSETSRYVYRIIAVKLIFEDPEKYGFQLEKDDLYQPYKSKTVTVNEDVDDLVEFAIKNGTNYKTLKILNPWLKGKKLNVRKGRTYDILIPKE